MLITYIQSYSTLKNASISSSYVQSGKYCFKLHTGIKKKKTFSLNISNSGSHKTILSKIPT